MYTNNTTTPLIYRFTKTLQKTVSTTNNFSSLYTHTRTHTHIRHTSWLCISGVVQCRMKQWDYHDDMRQQVTWPPLTSRNSLSPHLLPSFSLPHFASLSCLPLSACDVRTPPTLSLWCEDYGGLTGVRTVCLCASWTPTTTTTTTWHEILNMSLFFWTQFTFITHFQLTHNCVILFYYSWPVPLVSMLSHHTHTEPACFEATL